jgi:hypothetical protein
LRNPIDIEHEAQILQGRVSSGEAPWVLESARGRDILQKLMSSGVLLGQCFQHAYVLDEGLRGAFVLRDVRRDGAVVSGWSAARGMRVSVEAGLVRSAVSAADIGVLGRLRRVNDSAIIYPYDRDSGEVITWRELRRFPLAVDHLTSLQVRLMQRRGHGASDGWWVPRAVRKRAPWHRPSDNNDVLLMRRHSSAPHVAIAPPSLVPSGNVIAWFARASNRLSLNAAVALFSSSLWWWVVQISATVGRGKLYRLSPTMLSSLSVPDGLLGVSAAVDQMTRTVEKASRGVMRARDIESLWCSVDEAVYGAYGLTAAERAHVECACSVYSAPEARLKAARLALQRCAMHVDRATARGGEPDLFTDLGGSEPAA